MLKATSNYDVCLGVCQILHFMGFLGWLAHNDPHPQKNHESQPQVRQIMYFLETSGWVPLMTTPLKNRKTRCPNDLQGWFQKQAVGEPMV